MSHSKRNTSLAFFTSHERAELRGQWGSRATRLTRDSFLPFGACALCLRPARDPVACATHGHLFCRECALSNLLAQTKELKRQRKEAERRRAEEVEGRELDDAEARARAVEEFERVQAGLSVRVEGRGARKIVGQEHGKTTVEQEEVGGEKGVKRKFELDEGELAQMARAEQDKARRQLSDARAAAKEELPSFWVPGKTPENQKAAAKAIRSQPTCPAAAPDRPHDLALKGLVTVRFTQDPPGDASDAPTRTCPSCTKALSNSTKAVLAKPCGHVVCKPCSDKFQKAGEQSAHEEGDDTVRCYVCQEDVTPGRKPKRTKDGESSEKDGRLERGLVGLSSEGTGFAGGGKNMVKKDGVAFQC